MKTDWLASPGRPTTRIAVDVTFLDMRKAPVAPPSALPGGYRLALWEKPDVEGYLALYDAVGRSYCWWMRHMMPPHELEAILHHPDFILMRLHGPQGVAGFFELDGRIPRFPYLAHLGLIETELGKGLGRPLLEASIHQAWSKPVENLRVNTGTADHPRALSAYLKAGFRKTHVAREEWDIPDDLHIPIPEAFKIG